MPEILRGKFALSNIVMMTVDRNFFLRSVHKTGFSEVSVIAVFSEFDCCFCGVPALNHTLGPEKSSCLERVRFKFIDKKHRHKTKVRKCFSKIP